MKKELLFIGAGVALVTPFDKSGNIAWDEIEKLVEFQIENGTDAIIACGTTGEAATMTTEDHIKTIDFIIQKVNGRIPVIAGTGSNDTHFCVELSLEAKKCGADGLLLVTPYYNKTSQKGLIESFRFIADSVRMPCVLYNVPSRTGCNIQPDTYCELAKNPYVVAVKEANGDTVSVARTIALCGEDLAVYSGEDNQTLPIMALGGKGVISVLANIMPRQTHDMCRLFLDGKIKESRKMQLKLLDIMDALFWDVNPIPVKAALSIMGVCTDSCRLPLTPMGREQKKRLAAVMQRYGLTGTDSASY